MVMWRFCSVLVRGADATLSKEQECNSRRWEDGRDVCTQNEQLEGCQVQPRAGRPSGLLELCCAFHSCTSAHAFVQMRSSMLCDAALFGSVGVER
mmetsp:Transcript_14077/g.38330  ORF Transcript_14077/g.38330 Transcript_14077/m.38330 type:complete len:95 (-) Transcript_14077:284-568(-)